jgi:hypothetical protein
MPENGLHDDLIVFDGLIVSNTTLARPGSLRSTHRQETGGRYSSRGGYGGNFSSCQPPGLPGDRGSPAIG